MATEIPYHGTEISKTGQANSMSQRFSIWAANMAIVSALVTPAAVNTTAAAAPLCGTDSLSLSTGAYGARGDSAQMHSHHLARISGRSPCTLPGLSRCGPRRLRRSGRRAYLQLLRTERQSSASHQYAGSGGQQPTDLLANPQRLGASHDRGDAAGQHGTATDAVDSRRHGPYCSRTRPTPAGSDRWSLRRIWLRRKANR